MYRDIAFFSYSLFGVPVRPAPNAQVADGLMLNIARIDLRLEAPEFDGVISIRDVCLRGADANWRVGAAPLSPTLSFSMYIYIYIESLRQGKLNYQ